MKRIIKVGDSGRPEVRDSHGKFAPGHKGGPGRRPRPESVYLRILWESCSPEQWRQICTKATSDALAGDRFARDWLSKYMIGEPTGRLKTISDVEEAEARADMFPPL